MMLKFLSPFKRNDRKFRILRLVISCILIATVLVSISIGLVYSRYMITSEPIAPDNYSFTHGLQADGVNWIVVERAKEGDTVIEALDGNVKITIPETATGTQLDRSDYLLLTYPVSLPSYSVGYNSAYAGNTYYQYEYYDNFNLVGFGYSNTNQLNLAIIQDNNRSMSIEFKVGKDFVPTSVKSGYTYDEENGVIKYSNINRFYNTTALYSIRYKKETWQKYADTSWYDTTSTAFILHDAAQLAGLAAIVNGTAEGIAQDSFAGKTITLGDDISLYSDEDRLDGSGKKEKRPWVPIGSFEAPFSGSFDGDGHTISGLNIPERFLQGDDNKDSTSGLFGMVTGTSDAPASVSNVYLEDINLAAHMGIYEDPDSGQAMGALIGRSVNCNISNVHVNNMVVNRDAKYVGGILGRGDPNGSIRDCSVQNTIFDCENSNNIGGIVGIHYGNGEDINISNCYVSAQFRGVYASAGGIVGFGNGGAMGVENCYFIGNFTPTYNTSFNGGILGMGFSGVDKDYTINNCYADCDADLIGHSYFGYYVYEGQQTIEQALTECGNRIVAANSNWSGDNNSFTWLSYAYDAGYDQYVGTVDKSDSCWFSAGMTYQQYLDAFTDGTPLSVEPTTVAPTETPTEAPTVIDTPTEQP